MKCKPILWMDAVGVHYYVEDKTRDTSDVARNLPTIALTRQLPLIHALLETLTVTYGYKKPIISLVLSCVITDPSIMRHVHVASSSVKI